ncbi:MULTISPECIES: hypothetical protein [unclassified Bosea (in: a-proteobacteria)]|uniref:hypothetical protein n=1 Tax=unclassified Bosea (in: a-proteobacteria) TaxID=2653178 RepID=UPI000F7512C0|nr:MULTISPECIES: hypothetical protein [unclassified Bosea (in: a-proteobacteria)]AZO78893.1 hypothetical protein BLM15_15630 [Bosea sp. Tri-49]RXT17316.1 hypothetical protein B5U98_24790 [Bosea sp. Tri-39]RXT40686.1 hypothetical protein B5U99_02660 [Bosea sp. Tri-54]
MLSLWDSISAWFWDISSLWTAFWRALVTALAAILMSMVIGLPAGIPFTVQWLCLIWFFGRWQHQKRQSS